MGDSLLLAEIGAVALVIALRVIWARRLGENIKTGKWEMDLTSCDKYSGCIYMPICESDPALRERKITNDYVVGEEWDVAKALEASK